MRMSKLAFSNFCNSIQNYLSLVLSLAFTIMIYLNFQNLLVSDAYAVLGSRNKEYVELLVAMVLFVLSCFTFFFVWYSTNVFLTRRKKEIGIYIFMGLTNQQIGKMYAIETSMIGVAALVIGCFFGELFGGLFQMLMAAFSRINVEISFTFSLWPLLVTALFFIVVYLVFVVKGYVNIVRSSVSSMLSATRQNEAVRQNAFVLAVKTLLGVGLQGTGFYLALKEYDVLFFVNAFLSVVLVTVGVYFLFGGLIPLLFQGLSRSKAFLYGRERVLWVNNMVFRIRKNYRTYAMVTVLSLCSVTALACGFGMKVRYDNMEHFRHTYTFQLITDQTDLWEKAEPIIEESAGIAAQSAIPYLQINGDTTVGLLDYAKVVQLAEVMGIPVDFPEPSDGEIVKTEHVYLMSFAEDEASVNVGGEEYRRIATTCEPYLGYFQERDSLYIVNTATYDRLRSQGTEYFTFNYRIADESGFAQTKEALTGLKDSMPDCFAGIVSMDPASMELVWVRVMYSICIFMFLVFIVAGGCIMFMKQYNDAFEERDRYQVLQKLGVDEKQLRRAVAKELGSAYLISFLVMAFSSAFSVHSLAKAMRTDLSLINIVSVLVVLAIFLVFYGVSVTAYRKNTL